MDISRSGGFINGKTRNAVYKDMIFISPVELVVLFICLVRSRMYTESTVLICLGLAVEMKLIFTEIFRIILKSIGKNRSGIQPDKRGIDQTRSSKSKDLFFHNIGESRVIEGLQRAVKSPVRRKRRSNIRTAVMCDEKIVVEGQ